MRSILLRFALALAVLAAALPSRAAFHLWAIDEVFSNADGSVQFIEFVALTGGQQFLSGHSLVSQGSGATRNFNFTTDLPGDTSGRRFLVGTQGFAALAVVTPDYVVPNGFLFTGGGTLTFAEGADSWTYPALPVDGMRSLSRSGASAINSPTNFARVTGSVTLQGADFNVQGLWWRSPAESESGWGMNIVHQGTILFVTWFTYDTDGGQLWLVMNAASRTAANTYAGSILRTTGPAFSAVPFSPSLVAATTVGSATLTFTDANNGTFAYTVSGVTQSKPITRQVFSSPQSVCTQASGSTATRSFQDLWWNSPAGSESGWGVNLTHQGDILFGTWFTYEAGGRGQWFVMPALRKSANNVYSGNVHRTTGPPFNAVPFSPSAVTAPEVGTATFTFASADSGTFAYTVNGVSQTKTIERQVYAIPASVCTLTTP